MLDFDQITDNLFVGRTPHRKDYRTLKDRGVKLIINMRLEKYSLPIFELATIPTIWVPTLDSMFTPIRAGRLIGPVERSLEVMNAGGKVYVYCKVGRHRSVLMAACILVANGQSINAATDLLKQRRQIADPDIFYIHKVIVDFAKLWEAKK